MFIYEPGKAEGSTITSVVSQLDVLNTILHFGGVKDSITSYGENLADPSLNQQRTVFTKINGFLYQAISQQYVLGFDALQGKALYCYDYQNDPFKKNNLLAYQNLTSI